MHQCEAGNMFAKKYLNSRVLRTIHWQHALLLVGLICSFTRSVKLQIHVSSHASGLVEAVKKGIQGWREEAGIQNQGSIPVPAPRFNPTYKSQFPLA